jgi:SAM-dependent methyltransferase
MVDNEFKLADGAARIYEEYKVPTVFGPLAAATTERMPPQDGDRILDLACGTGILARTLRQQMSADTMVTGADINIGMLAVAAEVVDPALEPIEWREANVMDLPFADGAFNKLYCQQGFQFFPDEQVALREMRRVLQLGGRLLMTIWRGDSALFETVAQVLAEHFDQVMADKTMLPFRYGGRDSLIERIGAARFSDISRDTLPIDRVLVDSRRAVELEIAGSPVAVDLAGVDTAHMQEILAQCHAALRQFRQGDDLILRQTTDVYLATACA